MEVNYKEKIDRYAILVKEQAERKSEMDEISGFFETLAEKELKDTKVKSKTYWGSNATISVGNTESVKLVSNEMLKMLFGKVYVDFVKKKETDEMTAPCKKFLGMVFQGNYVEGNIESILEQITNDKDTQSTLRKKLKGDYEKDKKTIIAITGLSEQEASDWAYLTTEVLNYEHLLRILYMGEWNGSTQQAIDHIKSSVIVDEGIKVTFKEEKPKN